MRELALAAGAEADGVARGAGLARPCSSFDAIDADGGATGTVGALAMLGGAVGVGGAIEVDGAAGARVSSG